MSRSGLIQKKNTRHKNLGLSNLISPDPFNFPDSHFNTPSQKMGMPQMQNFLID